MTKMTKTDILTITAHANGQATAATSDEGVLGRDLAEAAAMVIAAAVRTVEQMYLSAGCSRAAAAQAGGRVIDRAGVLLSRGESIVGGSVVVKTAKRVGAGQ